MQTRAPQIDIVENVLKGLVVGGVSPQELLLGLRRAFRNGDILTANGYRCSHQILKELLVHFDAVNALAKDITEFN
jgi:hypothetical protein